MRPFPQRDFPPSALEAIGGTPLVELSRLVDGFDGRVLAKLEAANPTGSRDDRVARQVIEDAVRGGRLEPHRTVVGLSTGRTGAALAMVCALTRHPCVVVALEGEGESAGELAAYGAELLVVERGRDSAPGRVSPGDLARLEERVKRVEHERGAFWAETFGNVSAFRAHRLYTGPEILQQTRGRFDAFCDFAATGAAFAGCAAAFKEHDPSVRCFLVEPAPGEHLGGGGFGRPLPLLDPARIDGRVAVTAQEAREAQRVLARLEGIFSGPAGGASVAGALALIAGPCRGDTLVVTIADSGLRALARHASAAPDTAAA